MLDIVRRLGLLVALLSVLVGCATGNTYQYANTVPALQTQSSKPLALAVLDQRSYILNKDKIQAFVGLQRGGFGNPFDVTTVSGRPLAADMTQSLASALRHRGMQVKELLVEPASQDGEALKALLAAGQERAVLLCLREWKSDTMVHVALRYDLNLAVYDTTGKLLANQNLRGEKDLGGSMMNAPAHARQVIPVGYKQRMEELFALPEIDAALR
jgi:hypothetical protein